MRVLAAQFQDREVASRVLAELRTRYDLRSEDAQIAPLGVGTPSRAPSTVLAGRFREQRVQEVTRLIEGAGGTVIANIDEGWTKPPGANLPDLPDQDRALPGSREDRRRDEMRGVSGSRR